MSTASPAGRRDRFAIGLLPLGLLLLNHEWIFPGPARDPWIYYGFFRGLPEYMRSFTGSYFASRLSVILPGWLVYRVFSSLAANVVLHVLLFWLATLSFHAAVSRIFGRRAALLATLLLACHPFFLDAIGGNYVDGFGLAYVLAGYAVVTRAAGPDGRRRDLVLAGGLATACVSANLFYAVFLPFLALHYLVLRASRGGMPLLEGGLCATAGAAGAGLVFSLSSKLLGGRYLYFLGSTSFAQTFRNQVNPFKRPPGEWLPAATWLVLPVLVALSAAVFLVRLVRRRDADPCRLLAYAQIQFLLFLAMLVAWQAGDKVPALQHSYYASLLLPSLFLALAGQLAPVLENLAPRRFVLAGSGAAALLALSVFLASPLSPPAGPASSGTIVAVAAGLPAILIVAAGRRDAAAALLLTLSLATSQTLSHRQFGQDPRRSGYGEKLALFRQIDESVTAWRRVDASGALHFWFDAQEPPGLLYDLVASTSLWGARLVSTRFPELPGPRTPMGRPLGPGLRIAILSQQPAALDRARSALSPLGLGVLLLSAKRIDGPAGAFTMTFIETTR